MPVAAARVSLSVLLVLTFTGATGWAADWPMWRCDAARSAETEQRLPRDLRLRWTRQLKRLKPAYREPRLQFDSGYEPVVAGKTMFVGSSRSHSLSALSTETGNLRWEFFCEGPVRFAPAVWDGHVYVGSDDGCLYCLDANDGSLRWKRRAAPSHRKVLGNGRMISLWPVRGGPVAHQGKVYFAAGVWSFEGVFVYCLDAKTGGVVWRNDDSSFIYGQHPHDARAIGGVTPQGYLVVANQELIVPCGQAMPARYDLKTGKLLAFELPKPGRRPGGWFASSDVRRGVLVTDAEVNRDLHEDKVYQGPGSAGVRSTITISGEKRQFSDEINGVDGDIHTILAADDKLFVVDVDGRIHCFAETAESVSRHKAPEAAPRDGTSERIAAVLQAIDARDGYALLRDSDLKDGEAALALIDSLLRDSRFHVVAALRDKGVLAKLRARYRADRERLCLLHDEAGMLELPPYFASVMIADAAPSDLEVLRPYGGAACLWLTDEQHAGLVERTLGGPWSIQRRGEMTVVRRGKLSGAANYAGGWSSPDERVRAPLGVLWFDDSLGHFKRSPQPWFVDGVMISYPKNWMEKHDAGRKPPYDLLPAVFSDVYTGRVLPAGDAIVTPADYPRRDLSVRQPNQYRPPSQKDDWKPDQPVVGKRINPLTGQEESRAIAKSYGCDGGVDYGHMYTMRSGTPSFYDKRLESGVCNISGPRSGCTNSVIPACGVLNIPFFYEGCTCSYPLPVGLALVSMPPSHEQWFSWGPGEPKNIQQVGINLGAPGDRVSPEGTLWLDYPSRGGPSPQVSVEVKPDTAEYFYQHSLFAAGGEAWPWVAASGVEGARTIRVADLRPDNYTVRLYFIEPTSNASGARKFDIRLNGQVVEKELNVVRLSGRSMRPLARTYANVKLDGSLEIELIPRTGKTILSGVEIYLENPTRPGR